MNQTETAAAAAAITYDPQNRIFLLQGARSSYLMQIVRDGYLAHLHWGGKIRAYHGGAAVRMADRAFSPNPDPGDRTFSLDTLPQEYPACGHTDFRSPAVQLEFADGSRITDFRYESHRIFAGKPALAGLPATYVEADSEAETLEITLCDTLYPIRAILTYTVFKDTDILTRSVRLQNDSPTAVQILKAASLNVDFRDAEFERLHLSGTWGRERQIIRQKVEPGVWTIESRRGASSHQHNPFVALLRPGTTETTGEAYAVNLVYSGNFRAEVEVDGFATTRLNLGINPFDFCWRLDPGESFQTPEAVMVYSPCGLGDLSRSLHRLYRRRLCRGLYRDRERPILLNTWEAAYFDFTEETILSIARAASTLGVEMLVLDDGWFGRRSNDCSSLGDWQVNLEKLPHGLQGLAAQVEALGLKFGLWVEPEMVSPDSDLYRAHPDWCLHVPGRRRSESRNQLVLDLARPEVQDYIIGAMSAILDNPGIQYVKWDMNRNMTEIGSAAFDPGRQKEIAHRYILGLYRVLETLVTNYPRVLFESCSGGGGRFDPGMLYYMPQTWTSDNTDAVGRLHIQQGTSLAYPAVCMGAHVSASPNHQVGRVTSLTMRGHAAMTGNFGYELDVRQMGEAEKAEIRAQIAFYQSIRPIVQFGDQYRLLDVFAGNEAAIEYVTADGRAAVAFYFRILGQAQEPFVNLRLQGLNQTSQYRTDEGTVYGGDELMTIGLPVPPLTGDFQSWAVRLQRLY
jgi:alpha-galactosidase